MTCRKKIRHVTDDWGKTSIFLDFIYSHFGHLTIPTHLLSAPYHTTIIQDTWSQSSHPFELLLMLCQGRIKTGKEVTSSLHPIPQSRASFPPLDSQPQMATALLELKLTISKFPQHSLKGECFSLVPLRFSETSLRNRSVLLHMAWMNCLYWMHSLRSLVDEVKGRASSRVMAVTGKAVVWWVSWANICDWQFRKKAMALWCDCATQPNSP